MQRRAHVLPSSDDPAELHPDVGCEVSPRCVECPLPICKYDDLAWYTRWKTDRLHQVLSRQRNAGTPRRIVAQMYDVSIRTVDRAVQRCKTSAA